VYFLTLVVDRMMLEMLDRDRRAMLGLSLSERRCQGSGLSQSVRLSEEIQSIMWRD